MLLEDRDIRCTLHDVNLNEGCVLIVYGLIRYSDAYREAHRQLFPKSKFIVFGGCGFSLGSELVATVRYCPLCREAHLAWCSSNGSTEGLPPTPARLERIVRHHFGSDVDVPDFPDEARVLWEQKKLVAALKVLKSANPGIEIADLRRFLLYLNAKVELEKKGDLLARVVTLAA